MDRKMSTKAKRQRIIEVLNKLLWNNWITSNLVKKIAQEESIKILTEHMLSNKNVSEVKNGKTTKAMYKTS